MSTGGRAVCERECVCVCVCVLGCRGGGGGATEGGALLLSGMKLGAAESSHTQLTVGTEWTQRLSLPPKLKHTAALARRPTHTDSHTHSAGRRRGEET